MMAVLVVLVVGGLSVAWQGLAPKSIVVEKVQIETDALAVFQGTWSLALEPTKKFVDENKVEGCGNFDQKPRMIQAVYESLNIASLWSIPILFILENNYYAQSTPSELQIAGSILKRPEAFNINTSECSSNDVREIYKRFKGVLDFVRKNQKPHIEVINTYRLAPHSKGDDDRSIDEINKWKLKDPLKIIEKELPEKVIKKINNKTNTKISSIIDDLLVKPSIIKIN